MVDGSKSGILFDAYGTLFDVYSIRALAEELFPGQGAALATLWRDKQIDYTRLRTLSDRYVDFLTVTEEALRYSCDRLRLVLSEDKCRRLLGQYHRLTAYPEVRPALERLRAHGLALAVLSKRNSIDARGRHNCRRHVGSIHSCVKRRPSAQI